MPIERPKVNDALCFVCQETEPTHKVTRNRETFTVCERCAKLIESENTARNRVKTAIRSSNAAKIFEYTLGADLSATQIKIEKL